MRKYLETILNPETCKFIDFEYQEDTESILVDLEDPLYDAQDSVRVDAQQILELYQNININEPDLYKKSPYEFYSVKELIDSTQINIDFLSDFLRSHMRFASLEIQDFADLDSTEKCAYLNNAVVVNDDSELRMWTVQLLHFLWNGYPTIPNIHPEVTRFAIRAKRNRVKPTEAIKDLFKGSFIDNVLEGHEVSLS